MLRSAHGYTSHWSRHTPVIYIQYRYYCLHIELQYTFYDHSNDLFFSHACRFGYSNISVIFVARSLTSFLERLRVCCTDSEISATSFHVINLCMHAVLWHNVVLGNVMFW